MLYGSALIAGQPVFQIQAGAPGITEQCILAKFLIEPRLFWNPLAAENTMGHFGVKVTCAQAPPSSGPPACKRHPQVGRRLVCGARLLRCGVLSHATVAAQSHGSRSVDANA